MEPYGEKAIVGKRAYIEKLRCEVFFKALVVRYLVGEFVGVYDNYLVACEISNQRVPLAEV